MIKKQFIIIVFVLICKGIIMAQDISVPLTVTNRTTYDKWELASGGVPMPIRAVKHTSAFRIIDKEEKPVPAQFTILNKWPSDQSIRWMLVQFPVTLSANETGRFTLKTDKSISIPKPKAVITISEKPEQFDVSTGPLHFTINRKRFNIITDNIPGRRHSCGQKREHPL